MATLGELKDFDYNAETRPFTEWFTHLFFERNPMYKMVKCCGCDVKVRAWQYECSSCFMKNQLKYVENMKPIIRYL